MVSLTKKAAKSVAELIKARAKSKRVDPDKILHEFPFPEHLHTMIYNLINDKFEIEGLLCKDNREALAKFVWTRDDRRTIVFIQRFHYRENNWQLDQSDKEPFMLHQFEAMHKPQDRKLRAEKAEEFWEEHEHRWTSCTSQLRFGKSKLSKTVGRVQDAFMLAVTDDMDKNYMFSKGFKTPNVTYHIAAKQLFMKECGWRSPPLAP